jgi:hypothetical protein
MMFLAMLVLGAVAADGPEIRGDMLRFMDASLPEKQYVATHAEARKSPDAPWTPVTQSYQCFKTKVNYDCRQVYFRKDDIAADYYGEIFTFDDKTIRLHVETYPPRTAVDPPEHTWDARPDRFRCFVESGRPDWSLGRVFAPVDGSTDWRFQGYVDTYICHSFAEYNAQSAPRWQNHFFDNSVSLERCHPFSTVFDGEIPGWAAEDAFKTLDEAIVVNQCMENDAARERFIFGRKGDTYFGIVRWDNALKVDGKWVITERTVGLKVAELEPRFSFDGMMDRCRKDHHLKSTPSL